MEKISPILVILLMSLLISKVTGRGSKPAVNNTNKSDNFFEDLVSMSRMLDAEVPPYDPSKPPKDNSIVQPEQKPISPISPQVVVQEELPQKPSPYYPVYDQKWKKCCKLEKSKECCMKKAGDLPLYNLGTGMYYFHNDMTTAKNWFDALHFCRAHGMELVSIETAAENNMLTAYAQWFLGSQADFYSFYWTSLNDLGLEGSFTWAGTGLPVTYFSWHSGAPNGATKEDCGELWQMPLGTTFWNDRNCLQWKGRFICEMSKICYDVISATYE